MWKPLYEEFEEIWCFQTDSTFLKPQNVFSAPTYPQKSRSLSEKQTINVVNMPKQADFWNKKTLPTFWPVYKKNKKVVWKYPTQNLNLVNEARDVGKSSKIILLFKKVLSGAEKP